MTSSKKMIFDVGMHKGEDTAYYLKKGFRVVAFEADPDLIKFCREKFTNEIKTGDLTIVEGAIIDSVNCKNNVDKIQFYKNNKATVWGTVVPEWADRNEWLGSESEIIEVPIVDFSQCLKKYGVPYYLKIDIEGMDTVCLKALLNFKKKPDYISIESEKVKFNKLKEELDLFVKLGYNQFQTINQANARSFKEPDNSKEGFFLNYQFNAGCSGPFGTDLNPEDWVALNATIDKYKQIFRGYDLLGENSKLNEYYLSMKFIKVLNRFIGYPGWYDTHAKHSSVLTK